MRQAVASETFLIRAVGGPHPGTRLSPPGWPWPLPETLDVPGVPGIYRKVSESDLGPVESGLRIRRGAEYHWETEA